MTTIVYVLGVCGLTFLIINWFIEFYKITKHEKYLKDHDLVERIVTVKRNKNEKS